MVSGFVAGIILVASVAGMTKLNRKVQNNEEKRKGTAEENKTSLIDKAIEHVDSKYVEFKPKEVKEDDFRFIAESPLIYTDYYRKLNGKLQASPYKNIRYFSMDGYRLDIELDKQEAYIIYKYGTRKMNCSFVADGDITWIRIYNLKDIILGTNEIDATTVADIIEGKRNIIYSPIYPHELEGLLMIKEYKLFRVEYLNEEKENMLNLLF